MPKPVTTPITVANLKQSVPTEKMTAALAGEMASGLLSTADILTKFELTAAQLRTIVKDSRFKKMYWEAKAVWEGTENVQERIRQKGALLLEDSLMPLYKIIQDPTQAPAVRINAFAQLQSVSNMNPSKDGADTQKESFILNISVGDDQKTVTIEGTSTPVADTED